MCLTETQVTISHVTTHFDSNKVYRGLQICSCCLRNAEWPVAAVYPVQNTVMKIGSSIIYRVPVYLVVLVGDAFQRHLKLN